MTSSSTTTLGSAPPAPGADWPCLPSSVAGHGRACRLPGSSAAGTECDTRRAGTDRQPGRCSARRCVAGCRARGRHRGLGRQPLLPAAVDVSAGRRLQRRSGQPVLRLLRPRASFLGSWSPDPFSDEHGRKKLVTVALVLGISAASSSASAAPSPSPCASAGSSAASVSPVAMVVGTSWIKELSQHDADPPPAPAAPPSPSPPASASGPASPAPSLNGGPHRPCSPTPCHIALSLAAAAPLIRAHETRAARPRRGPFADWPT